MENYEKTDLACESVGSLKEEGKKNGWKERKVASVTVRSLCLPDEASAKQYGLVVGTYISMEFDRSTLLFGRDEEILVRLLAGEIRGISERLTKKVIDTEFGVLVVGLGNAALTVDAVGPRTVAGLHATRHLRRHEEKLYQSMECSSLSTFAPGVLGQTGMEALEVLQGTVACVKPDVMIIIDSLAAKSCERLASTIQITDVGITPGSGVGNHREELSQKSLGVPIIVVGVPTVVNSSTLVYDALRKAGINELDPTLKDVLENGKSFFVSPKESDSITERAARIISLAIGRAFTDALLE